MALTYEEITTPEIFIHEVFINNPVKFVVEVAGYNKEDLKHMFNGDFLEIIKEEVPKLTKEEMYSFWVWNC